MTGDLRIGRFWYSTSPTWGTWSPHEGDQQADEVAAEVTETAAGRSRVASIIRERDNDIARIPLLVGAATWVPDPAAGLPMAFMFSGLVRGDQTTPTAASYLAEATTRKPERGAKRFDHDAALIDLPIGPAVVEVAISAPKRSRSVVCTVDWMAFPTGFSDTIFLHYQTPFPELLDSLQDEAEAVAHSLVVLTEAEG